MLRVDGSWVYYGLIIVLGHLIKFALPQDIIACGGFVKSKVEINYSLIEVCYKLIML